MSKERYSKVLNEIIPQMIDKIFGYLKVIKYSRTEIKEVLDNRYNKLYPQKFYYLICDCICGKQVEVLYGALNRTTFSCGCVNGGDKRRKYSDPLEANAREAYLFYSKNKPGNLSFEQFLELSQLPCYYCGKLPSNITRGSTKRGFRYDNPFIYSGLDRVDNSKPHSYDNCVPCCDVCNGAKSDLSKQEFLDWIEKVYQNQSSKGNI